MRQCIKNAYKKKRKVFDGDPYRYSSFTYFIPNLLQIANRAGWGNVQLLAFLKTHDKQRFLNDWRDVEFLDGILFVFFFVFLFVFFFIFGKHFVVSHGLKK